jgi:hypothetical protein
MIDDIERTRIRTAERQKGYRRLEVKSICCPLCGETDPAAFEKDHIEGRNHGDVTYALCVTCHRKRTARQRTEHPPAGPDPRNDFEVAARFLLGAADFLEFIVERMRKVSDMLLRLAKRGITDIRE